MDVTVVLGQQGRLVIPADIRAQLGLVPGDRLVLRTDARQLVLSREQDALEQLQALMRAVPADRSLVDELLAERREHALTE